jgi:hypothetical protein
MSEGVIVRVDSGHLTAHPLSVLTATDEIQLGAVFLASVCDSYLLL